MAKAKITSKVAMGEYHAPTKWRYRIKLVSDKLKNGEFSDNDVRLAVRFLYWARNGDKTDKTWSTLYQLSKA